MNEVYYIKKAIFSRKANEQIIAFAGFSLQPMGGTAGKDGLLKISASGNRGSLGYLTLTFIIDTEDNEAIEGLLAQAFDGLTEKSFSPYFGRKVVKIIKFPLGHALEKKGWYLQEVNIYFSSLQLREHALVKKKLIPALGRILPFSFDQVDWWPEDQALLSMPTLQGKADPDVHLSIKRLFRRWFG